MTPNILRTIFIMKNDFKKIIEPIVTSYREHGGINHIDGLNLPNKQEIIEITREFLSLLFPGFFGAERLTSENLRDVTGIRTHDLYDRISVQISRSLRYACLRAGECDSHQCEDNSHKCAVWLLESIPDLRAILHTDVEAAFKGDPACYSHEEAIVCYPGIFAIAVHRLAHLLYKFNIPLIPRIMTEYAHHQTGVDIHPGAEIGEHFFMDHATGIVIGETTVIGKNVKLYQGVTLGAKSFPEDARDVRGHKRHPTLEDNVVIYANSTILGDIIIGKEAVIGGNTWITDDVAPGTSIVIEPPKMRIHEKKE